MGSLSLIGGWGGARGRGPPPRTLTIPFMRVAAAIGAQKAAGAVHPPACGVAFVWATSGQGDPMKGIGPLIGCVILIAVKYGIDALAGQVAGGKAKTK